MDTHVSIVLDSSGSMNTIKADTIGGFNEFLADQRDEDGDATVSLIEFNTNVSHVYEATPVEDAPELDADTYTPGGRTALHDAIIAAVDTAIERFNEDGVEEPDNVIFVVLTDGKENASETPQDVVRDRVEAVSEEREWEFLFIGANQDAALTATSMGMNADQSLNMMHTGEGTQQAYSSVSDRVSEARQTGDVDGFTEEDREQQTR